MGYILERRNYSLRGRVWVQKYSLVNVLHLGSDTILDIFEPKQFSCRTVLQGHKPKLLHVGHASWTYFSCIFLLCTFVQLIIANGTRKILIRRFAFEKTNSHLVFCLISTISFRGVLSEVLVFDTQMHLLLGYFMVFLAVTLPKRTSWRQMQFSTASETRLKRDLTWHFVLIFSRSNMWARIHTIVCLYAISKK